jgi:hypothetical protein
MAHRDTAAQGLETAARSRPPDAFVSFVLENDGAWYAREGGGYFALMLRACHLALSAGDGTREAAGRAERLAERALSKPERPHPSVELQLLHFVRPDVSADEPAGSSGRRRKMLLWLRGWEDLEGSIDPDFDPADVPFRNLSPPGGRYRSGIRPDAIPEPDVREAYEALLERNRRKAEVYGEQTRLRRLRGQFRDRLREVAVRAYGPSPADVEDLTAVLDAAGIEPETRETLLDAVRRAKRRR